MKNIQKKQKKFEESLNKVVVKSNFENEGTPSPIRIEDMGFESSQRDSPLKSNFEATGNPGGNVKTSNVHTTTNLGDPSLLSIPE